MSFNAKIDGTPTDGTAWNSFSYLYSSTAAATEVTATPIPVGIKAPSIPVLEKQVLDATGGAAVMDADTDYTFLIYQGTDLGITDGQELLKALYDGKYTFTEVTLTVSKDKATASMSLEDLFQYTASVADGTYTATKGTTEWTWTNNQSYTIVELTQDADYPFRSWNGSTYTNSYTFTYSNSTVLELTCVNQVESYELPSAGGEGTWLYTIAGIVLCGGAAVVLLRRKENE